MKPFRGYLMLLALVFGSIFVTVLFALASYVLTENKLQNAQSDASKGLDIAEAGIEYYKWHLAHFPTDLQNGTGHAGPYSITYNDPETGTPAGTINLGIVGNTYCGSTASVDLTSKGTPTSGIGSATIIARYARPSVALYSYIVNASTWAGSDRIINGPYHSNGGVRMDGTANAPVTSSLSTWTCTTSFGCDGTGTNPPPNTVEPGVFGSGTNQSLWSYPTPQVDFAAISSNFTTLKTTAQASGLYLPRYSTGNSNSAAWGKGYHLIFNANGTVTINRVTSTNSISETPLNPADPTTERSIIRNETFYQTYTIPVSCGLIFVEDNVWIDGVVPAKATVVAANVTTSGLNPNVYLDNNITYSSASGASGLTVISANDILISPDSPNDMVLNGIFIAQGGAFGRNLYACPSSYEPRGTLTITGTTVSNLRTGTKWLGGCGATDAGYQTRVDSFDRLLSTNPPPFTPFTGTDYEFVDWRQK